MVLHAKEILIKMNQIPIYNHSGGLTDINIFHSHGIEVINVGIGDHLPHTKREYVSIPEMVQSAQFCEKAVRV